MSLLEVIERLCDIVRLQTEIIKKQAETIEQANIAEEVLKDLQKMRDTAELKQKQIDKYYN